MAQDSPSVATEDAPDLDEADRLDREADLKAQEARKSTASKSDPSKNSEVPSDEDLDGEDDWDFDESDRAESEAKAEAKASEKSATPIHTGDPAKAGAEKKAEPEKGAEKASEKKEGAESPTKDALKEEPPQPPKTFKVSIDNEEFDLPERLYEKVKGRLNDAEAIQTEYAESIQAIVQDWPTELVNILTAAFKGDRERAYQHVLKEAQSIVEAEKAYQELDPQSRDALDAKHRAERAEAELKRLKTEREKEDREILEAQARNRRLKQIAETMRSQGLPASKDLQLLIESVVKQLEDKQKEFKLVDVVRHVHQEHQKDEAERARLWEEANLKLPDDEFARKYPTLIQKARKADIARLEKERSTAKTPPGARGDASSRAAERETVTSSNGQGRKERRNPYADW